MAAPERDTVYTNDADRTVYTRKSNGTGWFVGIIVALALLAIGYLVFAANTGPETAVDVDATPVIETPAEPAAAPIVEAPAEVTPMTEAAPVVTEEPAAIVVAPADEATAVEAAPATELEPTVEPVAPTTEPVVEPVAEPVLQ
ncbi:MAG TPA: hypothetical protein VGN60_10145 [Devosia sp.]|jgi:hypothetical protein|nr:hypothetical protein [Devosia sp.]